MNFPERLQKIRWRTNKKPSESGWIRKSGKACEILKNAICFEQGGHLDFFQAKNHGVDEGKNCFGYTVKIVPPFIGESPADEGSHLQLLRELVKEIDASKMGEHARSK